MRSPLPYDTGLYHIQSILWNRESPLPFGLANIHTRLGYNSAWFTAAALLWLPLLSQSSVFAINPLLAFFFFGSAIQKLGRPVEKIRVSHWFLLGCLFVFCCTASGRELIRQTIGGPTTDLAPILFALYCAYLAIACFETKRRTSFLVLTLLSTFSVMIKLSSAPLLLFPVSVFLLANIRQIKTWMLVWPMVATLLLWMLRGIALSGCLAYPAAATCFYSLPWAVKSSTVHELTRWINSWARAPQKPPNEVLGNWNWVYPWLESFLNAGIVQTAGILLACGVLLVVTGHFLFRKSGEPFSDSFGLKPAVAITAVLLLSLAYWFLLGPAVRFGAGFLIATAVFVLAFGLGRYPIQPRVLRIAPVVMILIFVAVRLYRTGDIQSNDLIIWPNIPAAVVAERVTHSGLKMSVPIRSDQCWAAPVPCVPSFNPHLTRSNYGIWPVFVDKSRQR